MGIPPVSLGAIGQATADPSAAQMQQAQAATPQPPPQQQQQAPPQQQQDDDPIHQQLIQKAQEALNAKTGVKQILQNFFSGLSHGMVPPSMTPQFKQEKALANLNQYESTKALSQLRDQQAAQYAPVPLVGLDNKPIVDPSTGKPITLPAAHAQTYYAGQAMAASRLNVQNLKNEGNLDVQDLRNQGAQQTHPVQGLINEISDAAKSGDMATYQNKLQQLQQVQGAATAQAQANKYEQFKSTQQYNVWKTNQDNQTKLQVAQMSAGKAPAAMMQTASFAQSGLNRLNDAQAAMQRLEARGVLGNVASNKIENWIFGNGLVDPTLPAQDKEDIGRLRAAASYTSSAAMRAHTGRTSREIYDDFKNTMGINQGPDAWKGAMQETRSMLNDYATGATNAAIQKLRGGAAPNTTSSGGSSGRRVIDLTK